MDLHIPQRDLENLGAPCEHIPPQAPPPCANCRNERLKALENAITLNARAFAKSESFETEKRLEARETEMDRLHQTVAKLNAVVSERDETVAKLTSALMDRKKVDEDEIVRQRAERAAAARYIVGAFPERGDSE